MLFFLFNVCLAYTSIDRRAGYEPQRYPIPKSLSSGKGLAIASPQCC